MEYQIEKLRGRIVETRKGAKYQIKQFIRSSQIIGHGYIFQIEPKDFLNEQITEMQPEYFIKSVETFKVYFAPTFKLEEGFFGYGEENLIEYLFEMLRSSLDENPDNYLKKNSDGLYEINFAFNR